MKMANGMSAISGFLGLPSIEGGGYPSKMTPKAAKVRSHFKWKWQMECLRLWVCVEQSTIEGGRYPLKNDTKSGKSTKPFLSKRADGMLRLSVFSGSRAFRVVDIHPKWPLKRRKKNEATLNENGRWNVCHCGFSGVFAHWGRRISSKKWPQKRQKKGTI